MRIHIKKLINIFDLTYRLSCQRTSLSGYPCLGIYFHIRGWDFKKYPKDIFWISFHIQGYLDLVLDVNAMNNPGLSHVQTSPVQLRFNAASNTKCSRNQRILGLNDVQQTVQRVHQVQEDLLFLGSVAPLRRRRGSLERAGGGRGGGGEGGGLRSPLRLPQQLPPPPRRRMAHWLSQGTDFTIAAAIATAQCRRRRLKAATKFELPWPCNSTGSLPTQHLLVGLGQLSCNSLR